MRERALKSLAAVGCVAALSLTGVGVAVSRHDDNSGHGGLVADARPLPTADVLKYWADSKAALSPLLLYVRQLPLAIKGVQDKGGETTPGQFSQAKDMANSFATARDLVGRIAVPASAPSGVGELLQMGCQLYREAALTLDQMSAVPAGAPRVSLAGRAAALQAIGDRLFDQVRRVLAIDEIGQDTSPAQYQYLPPVPAVADLPGGPAKPARSGLDTNLRDAGRIIAEASSGGTAPAADFDRLRSIASALEESKTPQREDVIGARLAISLAVVADGGTGADGAPQRTDAILMLSNDLWNQARTLETSPRSAIEPLGATKLTRNQVWTGGAFNGHPPALKPGEPVGSGLPGGLPVINPDQILKG
jgi:hypothetical protein